MNTRIPRWAGIALGVAVGAALIAVVVLLPRAGSRGHRIGATLYYDHPLLSFDEEFTVKNGNPNHPSTYSAQVSQTGGTPGHPQYEIRVSSSEVYGTSVTRVGLNLETGVLRVDASISGIEAHYTIAPPDGGGDYFDYAGRLEDVTRILTTVQEGCVLPEFNFNYPSRPELADTVSYVNRVVRQLAQLETIDAVSASLPHSDSVFRLGRSVDVAVRYKAKQDRDIFFQFRDKDGVYTEASAAAKAGAGTVTVKVRLPLSVTDPSSTYVRVCLVPKGMDCSRKLHEVRIARTSQSGDCLYNLYVSGPGMDTIHAGKQDAVYMNWEVLGARRIIVRVIDAKGQVVAEQSFEAADGGGTRVVPLPLPTKTPPAANAQVVARIVPLRGTWSDVLCEKVLAVRIE